MPFAASVAAGLVPESGFPLNASEFEEAAVVAAVDFALQDESWESFAEA